MGTGKFEGCMTVAHATVSQPIVAYRTIRGLLKTELSAAGSDLYYFFFIS